MFRYAVWAAVSTDEQVQDKDSLPNQIRDCRAFAERLGGTETHPPFVADGYSRSFYEGLGEAMAEIPPLKAAIEAAEANQYDVLVCRYFERFGTVSYPVYVRLGKLKKQLRSVQEPTQIFPPEIFDVTKDEATSMMIHMSGMKQDYRINRIITNLRDNMPRRIHAGLPPSRIPYAYKHSSNKEPPALVPELAAKLTHARDMLLAGESYNTIAAYLGVHRTRVASILGNPFYAGQVAYNKSEIKRLNNRKVQIYLPRSKWTVGQGQHETIFTKLEHEAIAAEIRRRSNVSQRRKPIFLYTNLLRCAVCGGRARRKRHGTPAKYRMVITCRDFHSAHILFEYDEFLRQAVHEIQAALRDEAADPSPDDTEKVDRLKQKQADKTRARRKIQEGFEADLYNAAEAGRLLRDLDRETEELARDLERLAQQREARAAANDALLNLETIAHLPEFFQHGDPAVINRALSTWLECLQLHPDGTIQIIKR